MHHQSQTKSIIASFITIVFIIVAFFGGFYSGQRAEAKTQKIDTVINQAEGQPDSVDFALFWKVWSLLNEKYVSTHKQATTTDKDRVYGSIQGMVGALGDPYTVFFPPKENEQFESQIQGNFEGVGMEMGLKDGALTVISALPGTPAKKAGMKTGDIVVKINDKVTSSMSVDQAVQLIRGKRGTEVTLTVIRQGTKDPLVVKIVRDVINLPTLDTSYDKVTNIFTIKLYSFSAQSAKLFRGAMRDFVLSKSNKLIIDLRGNPGGFLDAAVEMAGWFLPPGQIVVRENYGMGKPEKTERSQGPNIFNDNVKVVILIDGGSASASEILAGALSEYGKAQLVGTHTFGKGSVQEFIKVTPDTALKVTVARWLTPNGKSISEGGLSPNVEVKITEDDVKNGKDPQMAKAIELLSK